MSTKSKKREIRQKRLDLEKYYRTKYRTKLFDELERLIETYDISSVDGTLMRSEDFKIKMKYIYREMEAICNEIAAATDERIEKMHERLFN